MINTDPRSLTFQLSCLLDVKHNARSLEIRDGLDGLEATVRWLIDARENLRMFENLRKTRPELFASLYYISKAFPGVEIVDAKEAAE